MPSPKKRGKTKRHTALEERLLQAYESRTLDEAIERAAQDFLHEYSIPVQLGALAAKLNARIIVLPPGFTVGETHRLLDRHEIRIRAEDQAQQRQRFTLAHEYAHIVLDNLGKANRASPTLETLCDRLAAAILMPQRELRMFIQRGTPEEIVAIANAFDVSVHAASVRFGALTGCAVFRVSRPRTHGPQAPLPFSRAEEKPIVTRLAGFLQLRPELRQAILDEARIYPEPLRGGAAGREWSLSSAPIGTDRVVVLKPRH